MRTSINMEQLDSIQEKEGIKARGIKAQKFWSTIREVEAKQLEVMQTTIAALSPEDRELVQELCSHSVGTYEAKTSFTCYHINRCKACNKKLNEYDSSG